ACSMCSSTTGGGGGAALWTAGFAALAGAGACATGGSAATGSATATEPASLAISASNGDRDPGCSVTATNLVRTSNAAHSEAAEVCARSIGGRAFVGFALLHAATTSATAWCNSSELRWIRSRLSRKAGETTCSTALGAPTVGELASCDIRFRVCSLPSDQIPAELVPSSDSGSRLPPRQPPNRTPVLRSTPR